MSFRSPRLQNRCSAANPPRARGGPLLRLDFSSRILPARSLIRYRKPANSLQTPARLSIKPLDVPVFHPCSCTRQTPRLESCDKLPRSIIETTSRVLVIKTTLEVETGFRLGLDLNDFAEMTYFALDRSPMTAMIGAVPIATPGQPGSTTLVAFAAEPSFRQVFARVSAAYLIRKEPRSWISRKSSRS